MGKANTTSRRQGSRLTGMLSAKVAASREACVVLVEQNLATVGVCVRRSCDSKYTSSTSVWGSSKQGTSGQPAGVQSPQGAKGFAFFFFNYRPHSRSPSHKPEHMSAQREASLGQSLRGLGMLERTRRSGFAM